MKCSIAMRYIALFSLFSAVAVATTGQMPLTAEPTPETSTTPITASTALPVISYTTTIKLPDLNLNINAEQLDDPELENIISSLLPAEMLTLLVSATARFVSPSRAEEKSLPSIIGQMISATSTKSLASISTSVAVGRGGWRGVVEASTTISVGEGKVDL
ncbi:hypothetical protein BKA65DRAFT_589164 [Rhexocercosporidium sp. MPI-PUGE-AT-0058]|nr:hypothetical protein BKA65DRAFT_589164 [Rhexocercosporidium sp. MPI-PUGE-AT-0058]